MTDPSEIPRIAARLAEIGVPEAELCRRADINQTTWGRWKRGEFSPSMQAWRRVVSAYDELVEERGAAA